ncbi:MAG: polyprenyl synthetase family protein [Rhodothermales bacterium]|nr:polyprenyl synthetase family protein [Rhodothermales bacterium]
MLAVEPAPLGRVADRPVRSLDAVQVLVADDLAAFRAFFHEAMRGKSGLLNAVIRYVLAQKGKQIRPLLVLLAARASGGVTQATHRAASLVELLHTATLVHDDVVDDAERRRGLFSINALWKNKVAVLFGDFLLSRGLLLALDAKDYDTLHLLSDAIRRMSEGELLQIEKTRHLDLDEATYFKIISDKTASLISACTAAGATSAGASPEIVGALHTFGEKLGLAFQIRDDLFDYGLEDVGKPLGIDVQEKKLTLPLIYALREASPKERRDVLALVRKKKTGDAAARAVAQFAETKGGLAYAQERMLELAQEALDALDVLEPSPARDALADLTRFAVYRTK